MGTWRTVLVSALTALVAGGGLLAAAGVWNPLAVPQATPTPTATAARSAAAATPTPLAPEVGPSPLVVEAVKGSSLRQWNQVTSGSTVLKVWPVEAPSSQPVAVGWLPISAAGGSAGLQVAPLPGDAGCGSLPAPASQQPITGTAECFGVSLLPKGSEPLEAGTYTTTLFVRYPRDKQVDVPVQVPVGRPLWVLLLTVALGILAVEGLLLWRKSAQYRAGWSVRRARWIDALSEHQALYRPFVGTPYQEETERTALRAVQRMMGDEVKTMADWLQRGEAGKIELSDLPATAGARAVLVDPLRRLGRRYLANSGTWDTAVDELDGALASLMQAVEEDVAADSLTAASEMASLYTAHLPEIKKEYDELEAQWQIAPKPIDPKVIAARTTIRETWTLLQTAAKEEDAWKGWSAAPLLEVWTERVKVLAGHCSRVRKEVLIPIQGHLEAVQGLSPGITGQVQTAKVLKAMASIDGPQLESAKDAVERATYPLKYGTRGVPSGREQMMRALKSVGLAIPGQASALHKDAIDAVLLAQVQSKLQDIDDKLAQSEASLAELWPAILAGSEHQARFTRLVRDLNRILRTLPAAQGDPVSLAVKSRLASAYQHLLNGEILDAEIEVQQARAERAALAGRALLAGRKPMRRRTLVWAAVVVLLVFVMIWLVATHQLREVALWALGWLSGWLWTIPVLIIALLLFSFARLLFAPRSAVRTKDREEGPSASGPGGKAADSGSPTAATTPGGRLAKAAYRFQEWMQEAVLEYRLPMARWLIGRLAAFVISLAIGVTIVIATREVLLKQGLNTWGTPLNLIIAFSWGVLTHGILSGPLEESLAKLTASNAASEEKGKDKAKEGS